MQETWVRSLIQEDPMCPGQRSRCATTTEAVLEKPVTTAVKPCAQEPVPCNEKPAHCEESSPHSLQLEESLRSSEDPARPKMNTYINQMEENKPQMLVPMKVT